MLLDEYKEILPYDAMGDYSDLKQEFEQKEKEEEPAMEPE